MKSIGFLISNKNNEKRRALLPEDIKNIVNKDKVFLEEGYGESLDISDKEYKNMGVNIESRERILECDILVDVKLGDADYLKNVDTHKILYGWAHAVQSLDFTTEVIDKKHTVIAWEEMYDKGRYIFYKNREIAGEAAIMHAFLHYGRMPYETKVAIIGNGQTAKGALRVLHGLGADVDVYGRKLEKLFLEEMYKYDVIVNCVLWDTSREDRLIYKKDLVKFKKGTMIIDISCDPNLEIETSQPTTIDNPVYSVDGIIHYAVDNTPAMFHKSISEDLSRNISKTVDLLLKEDYNDILKQAIVIESGKIIDKRIEEFRKQYNL